MAKLEKKVLSEKRVYFKQIDFPQTTLKEAQRVPFALVENFGGTSGSPPDVALAINVSPSSSNWRSLTGASEAYGLTEGGFNATVIKLTQLGRKLVAPEEEGQDIVARREAILKPRILREFFEKYRRAKLPNNIIAGNVLKTFGLPQDRVELAIKIVKENGQYAGIVRDTPTGPYVNLDSPGVPAPTVTSKLDEQSENPQPEEGQQKYQAEASEKHATQTQPSDPAIDAKTQRVFISHGKQQAIVTQIKELLIFGNFEPIVSIERESTAIPVPEKVFEDMRSCGAGVLHVGAEGKYLDGEGKEHHKLNDNVLIEIGAAMALYGKRLILLVEKGVILPSNLQGLYRCEFEGEKLDYEATMKLLKTFSQFR